MSGPLAAFLAVLLGTGLMRLVELGVSRRRARARPGALVPEPWLFPVMAVLHAGLVGLPALEVVLLDRPFVPLLAALAVLVLAGATGLRGWTLWTLGSSWNVRVVHPESIVTDGPYRWIRHPNYLVVILEIASIPLLHTAWLSAIGLSLLNAFVLRHRIAVEEAALSTHPTWREAMQHKPRLFPFIW